MKECFYWKVQNLGQMMRVRDDICNKHCITCELTLEGRAWAFSDCLELERATVKSWTHPGALPRKHCPVPLGVAG